MLPEIRLHLAEDAFDLWERTEQEGAWPDADPAPAGRHPVRLGAGRPDLVRPPPFWAFPWAGGQALARYLLDQPAVVRGRAVLDIASGSGLIAIAAAVAGAATVTASEIDPFAVAAIGLNCTANNVRLAAILGDLLDGTGAAAGRAADVVLAGDVFYEREMAGRLLPWLARAHAAGAVVLVGDPGRVYLPRDRFDQLAAYQVPVSRGLEDADVKTTTVWRLR